MATPKTITAFKYRTEVIADITKHTSEFKKAEETVDKYGKTIQKVGKEASKAFDGQATGKKWGSDFGGAAVTALTGSIGSIGQTSGALVGTGIAPGIGSAIGSTIGSGIDSALQKVSGPILAQVSRGIELNKLLETWKTHFTAFSGSEEQSVAHLQDLKKLAGDDGLRMATIVEGSQRLEEFTDDLKLTKLAMMAAGDASASFFGKASTGFDSIIDKIGLIAEGGLTEKVIKSFRKMDVDVTRYIAEGTGRTEQYVKKMIAAGRLNADVAARLVAEGIERHKGGAAKRAGTVGGGVEDRADSLMEIRAAEGTQKLTAGIGDAYTKFVQILDSPQATKIVDFLDKMGGYVVNFTEAAVSKAVSVGGGIAEGIMNFSPASMMSSFSKLGDFVDSGLKTVFEIHSPSERSAREVGEPIGEGVGVGMVRKFQGFMQGEGRDQIVATLEQLMQDPKIAAFLDLISKSETGKTRSQSTGRLFGPLGSTDASKYFSATGGWAGMRVFSPTLHRQVYTSPLGGGQIVSSTAKAFSRQTGLNVRMDQEGQDMIMTWLISKTPGALEKIKSGDIAGAMKLLGGAWESFKTYNRPGTASASRLISEFAGSGAITAAANPMPVRVIGGPVTMLDQYKAEHPNFGQGGNDPNLMTKLFAWANDQKELTVTLGEQDAAIVNIIGASEQLITTAASASIATQIAMRPLRPLIEDTSESARAAFATNASIQKENDKLAWKNIALSDRLSVAIESISGQIPSQQVGKKRSLFSKILGIAAPFLSFIPGVGPILSTVAGIASNAIGGNYAGAVAGIAGGLKTTYSQGGFLSSGSGGGSSSSSSGHARAFGGPVTAGEPYIVGERRPELFVPNQNGWIHPSVPSGGLHPEHVALLERVHAVLDRLENISPGDVIAMGVHKLPEALGRNATANRKTALALGLR